MSDYPVSEHMKFVHAVNIINMSGTIPDTYTSILQGKECVMRVGHLK